MFLKGVQFRRNLEKQKSQARDRESNHSPSIPLTLERARKIVGHAEDKFATGKDIADAFTPFAQGGALTRLEALKALYIVIADYYHIASSRSSISPRLMEEFEKYVNQSKSIAMRIMSDDVRDDDQKRKVSLEQKTSYELNVKYFKSLDSTLECYWQLVYRSIGLDFATEHNFEEGKGSSPAKMKASLTPIADPGTSNPGSNESKTARGQPLISEKEGFGIRERLKEKLAELGPLPRWKKILVVYVIGCLIAYLYSLTLQTEPNIFTMYPQTDFFNALYEVLRMLALPFFFLWVVGAFAVLILGAFLLLRDGIIRLYDALYWFIRDRRE